MDLKKMSKKPTCLLECVLSLDDFLGFGVRQILGASPQTSKVQAGKYMKKIKDYIGGFVTVDNFPPFLLAWESGDIKVGRYPNRMRKQCLQLYLWCKFYHDRKINSINLATVYESKKKKELKGFGDWCIMSIARFRCNAECWVPGDSRVKKKMIQLGLISKSTKNHDKEALKLFLNNTSGSKKKKGLNVYFDSRLSIAFQKIHDHD